MVVYTSMSADHSSASMTSSAVLFSMTRRDDSSPMFCAVVARARVYQSGVSVAGYLVARMISLKIVTLTAMCSAPV